MGYREAYFYIRSKYSGYSDWPSVEAAKDFRQESRALFESAGWTVEPGRDGIGDTVRNGKQSLYLHPNEFCGPVREENISDIEALIRKARTFSFESTSLFKTYYEWSDAEYLNYLKTKKEEIAAEMLRKFHTASRNRYAMGGCYDIAERFHVSRIDDPDRKHDPVHLYVSEVFEELLAEGLLIKSPDGRGVRAAFKYEQKALQKGRSHG